MRVTSEESNVADPPFFTQLMLEQWIDDGEVLFENDTLTIFEQNVSYRLVPAVRVTGLIDGEDAAGLVGTTAAIADLQARGAEHVQGSLLIGDTAYTCEDGFVPDLATMPKAQTSTPAAAPTPIAPEAEPARVGSSLGEPEDMLADFLLKHL
jgi:hypothetical protein